MENIVQKIYDFIVFIVNTIKDLVIAVSGKKPFIPPTVPTTGADEETTLG